MCKFCTQNNSKYWDEIKTFTVITWYIKLMFVGVIKHTCHDAVSCFVKCMYGNWWQSSQNVTFYPTTLFHGLTFRCFSVSLICTETVLRFNCYELRELYLYCMLVIIVNVGIIWDYDMTAPEMGKKLIMSRNFDTVRQEIVLRGKPNRRTMLIMLKNVDMKLL